MQPLKISIYGDFWDCQIYMGRLYLWLLDGSLIIYNWEEIVNSLINNDEEKLPLYCAFTRGNYLYRPELDFIFEDREFKQLLLKKFIKLGKRNFEFHIDDLAGFIYGTQDNPFDELPTDTEIIAKELYGITDSGLWTTTTHRYNKKYPVKTKPIKIWDCKLLSIKANNYNQIALSGGDEGLFEYNPNKWEQHFTSPLEETENKIFKISKDHSLFSNYNYLSIYNSSNLNNSFFALFTWATYKEGTRNRYERIFSRIISEEEIFQNNGSHKLSWGNQDKIYRATLNGFEIVKYNRFANAESDIPFFTKLDHIKLEKWKGDVISGGISYFGTIVECESALVLALSDGSTFTIPEPITRWRVYPRSINYENHLHVITNDKIEIYSFNHDYFVDQQEKKIGIYYNKFASPKNKRRYQNFY